jgi:hypothetical protein
MADVPLPLKSGVSLRFRAETGCWVLGCHLHRKYTLCDFQAAVDPPGSAAARMAQSTGWTAFAARAKEAYLALEGGRTELRLNRYGVLVIHQGGRPGSAEAWTRIMVAHPDSFFEQFAVALEGARAEGFPGWATGVPESLAATEMTELPPRAREPAHLSISYDEEVDGWIFTIDVIRKYSAFEFNAVSSASDPPNTAAQWDALFARKPGARVYLDAGKVKLWIDNERVLWFVLFPAPGGVDKRAVYAEKRPGRFLRQLRGEMRRAQAAGFPGRPPSDAEDAGAE